MLTHSFKQTWLTAPRHHMSGGPKDVDKFGLTDVKLNKKLVCMLQEKQGLKV